MFTRLPFQAEAKDVFLPALEAADKVAREHGHRGVTYEGTGIRARGVSTTTIDAIEVQNIVLITADRRRVPIGQVLPEGGHLRELKSAAELTAEIVALIRAYDQ